MGCGKVSKQCRTEGCPNDAHKQPQFEGFCCWGCRQGWEHGPLCTGVHTVKCWRKECQKMKHSKQETGYCCWGCKLGTGCGPACENRPFIKDKPQPQPKPKAEPKPTNSEVEMPVVVAVVISQENANESNEGIPGFMGTCSPNATAWASVCQPHPVTIENGMISGVWANAPTLSPRSRVPGDLIPTSLRSRGASDRSNG
ncbi:unnamed protein product [Effrenium voratum]|nr:unnamed protein product [Effrenium voratum]